MSGTREGWAVRTADDNLPSVGDYVVDVVTGQIYEVIDAYRPEHGHARDGQQSYQRRVRVRSVDWNDAISPHSARLVWGDQIWRG